MCRIYTWKISIRMSVKESNLSIFLVRPKVWVSLRVSNIISIRVIEVGRERDKKKKKNHWTVTYYLLL